ncbi:MAG: acyl-CoA/acyl-ACP dehydrogenase [Polyangiaceae bacterium]|nr:acyl-CoA/acyl-ACP dehydrogenase [Polyangiaceae bacterium]
MAGDVGRRCAPETRLPVAKALEALDKLFRSALPRVRAMVSEQGTISTHLLNDHQLAAHALAYLRTDIEACRQLAGWAQRVGTAHERALAEAYVGETLRSVVGGIALGPAEHVALSELGITQKELQQTVLEPNLRAWAEEVASSTVLVRLGKSLNVRGYGDPGLGDETLQQMRTEFRKFTDREVVPIAQRVHRDDELIPMSLVEKMAQLGVFGLTIPEEFGGLGLGKVAMCVVTEELSRGYIGVGSLSTRAEIAADLIVGGGTDEQKASWLPRIASGDVLPTAVFTEPNYGSDLASVKTRGEQQSDGNWKLYGQKTWITHATRTDLMTVLARTVPDAKGYKGLSMFLAAKTRGTEQQEFPDDGITGTEIKVLGYRGMKEYELSLDGFEVDRGELLGGVQGQGFKQLMTTFESARIQTAARGVGVAQAALEDGVRYAWERIQFGQPIIEFPRVSRKLGRLAAQVQAARQLTLFAAREKDGGIRCDLEAGMAKLLATRTAWEAADANVQIHGGNGYAVEYLASRLLVDARVLSIFEGANEIQAHVVARRLLEQGEER